MVSHASVAQFGECHMASRASWKVLLALMIGNVLTFKADALTDVILREVEKYVPYGELAGTRECLTLYPRCHTNQGRHDRIQLYIQLNNGGSFTIHLRNTHHANNISERVVKNILHKQCCIQETRDQWKNV
jgi:hypothetical protein